MWYSRTAIYSWVHACRYNFTLAFCLRSFLIKLWSVFHQILELQCCISPYPAATYRSDNGYEQDEPERDLMTWDGALRKSTMEFQHRSYNLLTCNCHSFVANNLNRLGFQASGWNVVNVAALILLKGRWVSKAAMVRSYLPFVIVFCLGVTFGGGTFLTFLAFFTFLLVGWFVLGTYCVRNLVQL